jgi:hypothetical protein
LTAVRALLRKIAGHVHVRVFEPHRFDNHRRLRELVAELEELSLAIAEADPRWNR